jgi:hypothetical protein
MHVGAAAGTATAAAAAVAAGVTLVVVPHHHTAGHHPGGGTSVVAIGISPARAGTLAPATRRPRAAATPTARVVATVSAIASAGASATPGDVAPSSGSGPGSGPGEVAASDPASGSGSASESPAGARAGKLSVDPGELDITSPGSATVTLTAAGGPVDWSVSVPTGQTKKNDVVVTPASGTLEAGQSVVVTVTVDSATTPKVQLLFSPGGKIVKVVVG